MENVKNSYKDSMIHKIVYETVPFAFKIGDTPLRETASFDKPKQVGQTDEYAVYQRKAVLTDGLAVTAEYRVYEEAVNIAVTLQNTGSQPSAQIHDIDFLSIHVPNTSNVTMWNRQRILYSRGSKPAINDFMPLEENTLSVNSRNGMRIENTETRASSVYMPYFNYTTGNREGVIAAIGWSGHWMADFREENGGGRVRFCYPADFYLLPNESIALPTALVMPWQKDCSGDSELTDSFNLFRRFMKNHILPKQNGRPISGKTCLRAWGNITEAGHNIRFANMKKFGLTCDAYGVDADWYRAPSAGQDWYRTAGDWVETPEAYPHTLSWLAENGRKNGAEGFWLWFEFERAVTESKSYQTHPEYYLDRPNSYDHLVNMGCPEAREYIRKKLYRVFDETDITVFRVDFNTDPGIFFEIHDGENRKGITELQYYNGLYEFLEGVLKDYPNIVIDNCASGGKRLDYRMSGLSIPIMCRSDYFTSLGFEPEGIQAHTVGLSRWLPVNGDSCGSCTGATKVVMDTYMVRSSYGASFGLAAPAWELSDREGKWYRKICDEANRMKSYFTQDFYPLTGYGYSLKDWTAFEMIDENGCHGAVMAFRHPSNATPVQVFELRGLDENAVYTVTDIDSGFLGEMTGKQLSEGLSVELPEKRSSRILFVDKK